MVISETERRQNHISNVDPNHTLLKVSLACLKDRDVERPSAQQLCERLAALKGSAEYIESLVRDAQLQERNIQLQEHGADDGRDREIRSLRQQHIQQVQNLEQVIQLQLSRLEETDRALGEKDGTIAAGEQQIREKMEEIGRLVREKDEVMDDKERELGQKQDENQQLEREKNQIIEEKERELGQTRDEYQQLEREKNEIIEEKEREQDRVKQQLEEYEHVIAQFQERIAELEQLIPPTESDAALSGKQQSNSSSTKSKMTWKKGKEAPCVMSSSCNAVADGSALYVRTVSKLGYAFTASTSSWSSLPDSLTDCCAQVIVNNLLTLVGGLYRGVITNQLLSLTGDGSGRRWTEEFPPMPTKRYGSTALCTETALIVAGGRSVDYTIVEVMNTETLQWSTAADLPHPLYNAPGIVCDDHVYILSLMKHSKTVYTCPVSALILSCESGRTADVWNKVHAPLITSTTCVSILGRLLTIGGRDSNDKPITAVYMYDTESDSWEVISHMSTPRCQCFAAVLPDNQLMVVGGYTDSGETDSVELATELDPTA